MDKRHVECNIRKAYVLPTRLLDISEHEPSRGYIRFPLQRAVGQLSSSFATLKQTALLSIAFTLSAETLTLRPTQTYPKTLDI